jgi:nucleotide-binding universal stress UspA family protein
MTTLTTAGRQVAANLTERAFRAAGGVPGDLDVIIETPEGNPGPVLTEIATGAGDVLVVGSTRGHRVGRAVHGSVSAYCARHSRCPVTVVAASLPVTLADRLQADDGAGLIGAGVTMPTHQR